MIPAEANQSALWVSIWLCFGICFDFAASLVCVVRRLGPLLRGIQCVSSRPLPWIHQHGIIWYDSGFIWLALRIVILVHRDSWGHLCLTDRGEILGFVIDERLREHLPRMCSLIKHVKILARWNAHVVVISQQEILDSSKSISNKSHEENMKMDFKRGLTMHEINEIPPMCTHCPCLWPVMVGLCHCMCF